MPTSFDDIEFLLRSSNRVAVLQAFSDGPHTQRELVAETPASRVTVGRILAAFEERDWVVQRSSSAYETTTRGRLIAQQLTTLRESLDALSRLDPIIEQLGIDQLDVPLAGFSDATVTTPTPSEPNRHHRIIGLSGSVADVARMYTQSVTAQALQIHIQAVKEGAQDLALCCTSPAIDAMQTDDELGRLAREMANSAATFVEVEPLLPVPFMAVFEHEEKRECFVGAAHKSGVPTGVVQTDDERVLEWATQVFDRLDDNAVSVSPDDFGDFDD